MTQVAGYSGTPLPKKLGIKPDCRIALVGAPEGFPETLGPLPEGAAFVDATEPALDLILYFVVESADLAATFPSLMARLTPAGMLWVAWPKKASGVPTDLTFDTVQKLGLTAGLVDTKICAIDATWSGLKFVRRLKDRTG